MSFQDSDWTAHAEATTTAPPRRTNPYVAGAIGLGIGIAIGATATFLALQGSAGPDARSVLAQTAAAPHGAASAASAASAAAVAAAPAASTVTVSSTAAASAPVASQLAALPVVATDPQPRELRAAAASQPLSAAEVARRKERAWERFYRRPAVCEGNPSADQLVECGNHFIRNRREFEERWRTGSL
jgi:PPE-repeat protein